MDSSEHLKRFSKAPISAAKAHALLEGELKRARHPTCDKCRAPVPYWGPGIDGEVTWFLPTPQACPHGCRQLLAVLWARLSREYHIQAPVRRDFSG